MAKGHSGFSSQAGIFSLSVGVGHVVKDQVIGSVCPGLNSNLVRHAAFPRNKTAKAEGNMCVLSSCEKS